MFLVVRYTTLWVPSLKAELIEFDTAILKTKMTVPAEPFPGVGYVPAWPPPPPPDPVFDTPFPPAFVYVPPMPPVLLLPPVAAVEPLKVPPPPPAE